MATQKKLTHLARRISPDGTVYAWCTVRGRVLNLQRETWTLVRKFISCPQCLTNAPEEEGY